MTSSSYLNSVFEIPILAYHKVSPQAEIGLTTIKPQRFLDQICFLYKQGYKSVTFRDLIDPEFAVPAKPIIITFDDGYESIYQHALPVLGKYDFRSVIFVISGFIGEKNTWEAFSVQKKHRHLSDNQIIQMQQAGHEIGSHSETHPYMPMLVQKRAESEIRQSKQKLEDLIGQAVISFCYPYGKYSKRIASLVKKNAYRFATANKGLFPSKKSDPHALPRTSIYGNDNISTFRQKIENFNRFGLHHFSEWMIQRGALTGTIKKSFDQILSKSKD